MFLVLSSTYNIITHHCVVSLLTGELANIIFIYKTCFAWCTRVLRLIGTSFFAAAIRVDLNAFAVAFEANHAVFFILEHFFLFFSDPKCSTFKVSVPLKWIFYSFENAKVFHLSECSTYVNNLCIFMMPKPESGAFGIGIGWGGECSFLKTHLVSPEITVT